MADPSQGNINNQSPQTEGPGMEKRLLMAFVLMGIVLFLTQYIYKPAAPVAPARQPAQTQPVSEPATQPQAPAIPAVAGQVAAGQEETFVLDTDLYHLVFSNRGAVVRSWVLKRFKDNSGKPLDLVSPAGAAKAGFPFSLEFGDRKPPLDVNQALFVPTPLNGGIGIEYQFSDGRVQLRKSFRFQKNSYLADLESSALLDGKPLPHVMAWRGGFGDRTVFAHANTLHSLYFDPAANKLVTQQAKAAKNGPVSSFGAYSFAGIDDSYFAAVFLPSGQSSFEIRTFSDQVAPTPGAAETPHLGAGVGGAGDNRFSVFVGPKDLEILRRVNPKLEQAVDFGWFSIIAKPLFLSVSWINDRWVHNYGWSIIVVTIFVNFLLLPLKFSSLKSMKKMQLLQPQIAAINAKYKGLSLRDPKKADQNQEVMDLYKKHGVNPMGGCMPMIIQLPFFYAFYKVLSVSIAMRGAEWLWVTDLSQPEQIPIRILPIAMIISQFIMQKMTPATGGDPSQQKMMMFMPLVMGFMFYGFSSGLVLYWLTGNVVGIGQQWFFNRGVTVPAPAPPAKAKTKKTART